MKVRMLPLESKNKVMAALDWTYFNTFYDEVYQPRLSR